MTDHHPTNFEIEIDRSGLTRHDQESSRKGLKLTLTIAGAVLGLFILWPYLQNQLAIRSEPLKALIAVVGGGITGWLLSIPLYRLGFHQQIKERAEAFRISVEGPFLRIRTGGPVNTDRKLHFRSIIDYSVVETKNHRKFGIQSLNLRTTAGGTQSDIDLPGVVDCLNVRDTLAEVDALRENGNVS